MTSEEIKNLKLARESLVGEEVHTAMAILGVELNQLVREIAYQLAVANERNKPPSAEEQLILLAGRPIVLEDAKAAARRIMLAGKQGAALNAVIEDYPEIWAEIQRARTTACIHEPLGA